MNPMPAASQASSAVATTLDHVVVVLDRRHVHDLARRGELLCGDLGEPDGTDLALLEQGREQRKLLVSPHARVDAVQLEQVERLDAQAPQRQLALLAQVVGTPAGKPAPRTRSQEARLGRHHDVAIGVQRGEDQLF